ncbi:MAG: mechanosensitive ion channel [bacterium]|nr:mechanosensitive ion channel [bacterium]
MDSAPLTTTPASAVGLGAAWQRLDGILQTAIGLLPLLAAAAVVVALAVFVANRGQAMVVRGIERRGRRHNLALVLGRFAQVALLCLGVLVALSIVVPSFQLADLINVLGIGSVAIGFAFRDVLQNFLAGVLLLLNEPFRIGDRVVFGGYEGRVEEIATRDTKLLTDDGDIVVIPNGKLFTESVLVRNRGAAPSLARAAQRR